MLWYIVVSHQYYQTKASVQTIHVSSQWEQSTIYHMFLAIILTLMVGHIHPYTLTVFFDVFNTEYFLFCRTNMISMSQKFACCCDIYYKVRNGSCTQQNRLLTPPTIQYAKAKPPEINSGQSTFTYVNHEIITNNFKKCSSTSSFFSVYWTVSNMETYRIKCCDILEEGQNVARSLLYSLSFNGTDFYRFSPSATQPKALLLWRKFGQRQKKRIMQTHAHTRIHKMAKLHIDNWVGFISILLLRFRIVTPPAVWFSTNMQRISNIAASNLFVLSMLRLNGLCRKSNQTDLLPTLLLDRRMGRFLWWLKSLLKRLGNNNGDSNGSSHAYWMYAHMHNNFSYKRQSNGMTNFAINPVHLYSGDGFLCWSRNDG